MRPIELIDAPEWYEKASFLNEKFVEIKTNDVFNVQMQYPLLGFDNAEKTCFVREEVYNRLNVAAKNLPKGMRFVIWDAWRPYALQQELFTDYSEAIIKEFGLENESEERRNRVITHFVSDPVYNKDVPPVHTTGGAIDVTLEKDGKLLNMGTRFDEFTDKTVTSYFEDSKDDEIKENRRLLYWLMTEAGFTNLPSEWWHYDYGDRFWAYYNNVDAKYKGVFTREEIYE